MTLMQIAHQRLKAPLMLALVIIVLRIVLERLGAPESINNIFGVAWLYMILPVIFGMQIIKHGDPAPFQSLFVHVLLFGVYTRIMVAITYMLAYALHWTAPRFLLERGGNVGEGVTPIQGYFIIPARNALLWIVAAVLLGMILGGITLLIRRRSTA